MNGHCFTEEGGQNTACFQITNPTKFAHLEIDALSPILNTKSKTVTP